MRLTNPALLVLEGFWARYRSTWRTTALASFVEPLVYLAALGVGLGRFADGRIDPAVLGGTTYARFVAPGLLAALAFQLAAQEATWPVMSGFRWDRTYLAMVATPLRPGDIALGHLCWIAARLGIAASAFSVPLVLLGAWRSWTAPLSVPAAVLGGLAVAAPLAAWAATLRREEGFVLVQRFVVMPMFLFSGVLYPLSQLPAPLEWAARALPLSHAVALCRGLVAGGAPPSSLLRHTAYLGVLAALGVVVATRAYARRLGA
jgi:lipooligosaccharide transport system permease protein